MYHHAVMPSIAHGETWLSQTLPVSTVPNTGRRLSNSSYRVLDEEVMSNYSFILVWPTSWTPAVGGLIVCE